MSINTTQNNINNIVPQPLLLRTLSEHHWEIAQQSLQAENDKVWAGTFNGMYDTWRYWVTMKNHRIRRHSFSEKYNKEFIVEVN